MSATLLWRPLVVSNKNYLPDALRFALERRHRDWVGEMTFASEDIAYLSGLRDAEVDGAQTLIELIDKQEQSIKSTNGELRSLLSELKGAKGFDDFTQGQAKAAAATKEEAERLFREKWLEPKREGE